MKLLYPRCCVLDVRQEQLDACLRLQDADGPAHIEVRTFGNTISDVVVLSNWLASHGVTHVAIKHSGASWKILYEALQRAFTVLLIDPAHAAEAKDVQWLADLLAYGLVQSQAITPPVTQDTAPASRRTRLTLLAVMFAVLLAVYGVWKVGSRVEILSTPPPSVRWQQPQGHYLHPAGEPFTLTLPALERKPEKLPVNITLEPSMATASWLRLDRERLQLHGTAPSTAAGQTYQLVLRAHTEHAGESRLQVFLSITAPPQPPHSTTDAPAPPPLSSATDSSTSPPAPQSQPPERPSDASGRMKLWHSW